MSTYRVNPPIRNKTLFLFCVFSSSFSLPCRSVCEISSGNDVRRRGKRCFLFVQWGSCFLPAIHITNEIFSPFLSFSLSSTLSRFDCWQSIMEILLTTRENFHSERERQTHKLSIYDHLISISSEQRWLQRSRVVFWLTTFFRRSNGPAWQHIRPIHRLPQAKKQAWSLRLIFHQQHYPWTFSNHQINSINTQRLNRNCIPSFFMVCSLAR